MKKILAILLASVVTAGTFAFVGCGEKPSGDNTYNSDNPRPTMPTDKDMQTVENENIGNELSAYYNKLKENGYGKYMAYSFSDESATYSSTFEEKDGSTLLGTQVSASLTSKSRREESDAYCGIKGENSVSAAFTYRYDKKREQSVDSPNVKLSYLNETVNEKVKKTGIQKNTQLYGYASGEAEENGESEKFDRQLIYYGDNTDWESVANNIPCIYAVSDSFFGLTAYGNAARHIDNAIQYAATERKQYLFDDPELAEIGELNVKEFELTAKKSDGKFFVSAKYTVDLLPNEFSKTTSTAINEYSILIDLSSPASVSDLPCDGINMNNLSLSSAAANIAYPDVTSEQLTNAVKEGKKLTVNVVGGGDAAELTVYGVKGRSDIFEITDGKIVLDCAGIKDYIDQINGGASFKIKFCISFYYKGSDVTGNIYIDY